jgi:hypothetical protein
MARVRTWRPWKSGDVEQLRLLWRQKVPIKVIAERLGRSAPAISNRAMEEGLGRRRARTITQGQTAIIEREVANLVDRLALRLGIAPTTMNRRVVGACFALEKRRRQARNIVDLGGMRIVRGEGEVAS